MTTSIRHSRQSGDKDEPVLSIEEVARRLDVNVSTVYKWCRSGRLPAYNWAEPGERAVWRIDEHDLEEFMDSRRNRPRAPETPPEEA